MFLRGWRRLKAVFVDHIPGSRAEPLEEHLMVCHECQDRLRATDELLAAIRAAHRGLGQVD